MPLTARALFAGALLLGALAPRPAAAQDEKAACAAASEEAQTLRDDGKYRAARDRLTTCARESCPAIVRKDCEKWLGELDAMQPTVVLGARDPRGNDLVGARVLLDGAPFVDRIDGRPVAVDPGEHLLRYEAPGAAPVEQRVVVRTGEKNRMLTAVLGPPSGAPAPRAAAPAGPSAASAPPTPSWTDEPSPAEAKLSRHTPAAAYVLGGVGTVALASFVYFGLSGRSDVSTMRDTCAPMCAPSDVDAARAKLVTADVSLAVGVVAMAAAAWIFLHRESDDRPVTTAFVF